MFIEKIESCNYSESMTAIEPGGHQSVESIKKEALEHLEKAIMTYKFKSQCDRHSLDALFSLELKPISSVFFKLISPGKKHINDHLERFRSLKNELLAKGVDLSPYEPFDLLFESYNKKKLYSTMTKQQVWLIRHMVNRENKSFLTMARVYLAVGIITFSSVIILLFHNRYKKIITRNFYIPFFCKLPLTFSLYYYLLRNDLQEVSKIAKKKIT